MDNIHPMLQGSGVAEHDEAQLAVFEASLAMDSKHLEVGSEVFVHGASHLDRTSLCCLHYGESRSPTLISATLTVILQLDKIFNPFTLLVGPCLVATLLWKSTKPIDEGGYHLPWW